MVKRRLIQVMEQLLLAANPPRPPSEEEIAGQAVTTLDYGSTLQYIFSSADTIWVISDPLGERGIVGHGFKVWEPALRIPLVIRDPHAAGDLVNDFRPRTRCSDRKSVV